MTRSVFDENPRRHVGAGDVRGWRGLLGTLTSSSDTRTQSKSAIRQPADPKGRVLVHVSHGSFLKGGVRSVHSRAPPPRPPPPTGAPTEHVQKANQAIWCHLSLLERRHSALDSTMISILRFECGQLGCEVKRFR